MASDSVPPDVKQRLKSSYDAIAPIYTSWTEKNPSHRLAYLEQLLARLRPSDGGETTRPLAILELGCGAGVPVTAKLLADPTITVTANDISSAQLALGREKLGTERVTWVEGDMAGLEFADASFDGIVGLYSLIHLPREEQGGMLAKLARWLKPGGHVLVNFSAEEMEAVVMEGWLAEEGWMFWSGWGAEATLEKVKGAGLEVVVGEVVKDMVDASFLWVIAKPAAAA